MNKITQSILLFFVLFVLGACCIQNKDYYFYIKNDTEQTLTDVLLELSDTKTKYYLGVLYPHSTYAYKIDFLNRSEYAISVFYTYLNKKIKTQPIGYIALYDKKDYHLIITDYTKKEI